MRDEFSVWAMTANKILFSLAYLDQRRGFRPLGELLPKCLNVKWEFVKMAEKAELDGQPWTPEEFRDLCFDGFEKILGMTDGDRAHSQSGALLQQPPSVVP